MTHHPPDGSSPFHGPVFRGDIPIGAIGEAAPFSITTPASANLNENVALALELTADTSVDSWALATAGGPDNTLATISTATGGTVFLNMTAKDYESPGDANMDNSYVFRVEATKGGDTVGKTITINLQDVVAPDFTNASSTSVDENSALAFPITLDAPGTIAITGGADSALFALTSTTTSGAVLAMSAQDYESPADADSNNVYVVNLKATHPTDSNETNTASISVTVNDVAEGISWDFEHDFTGASLPANATFARASSATYVASGGALTTATSNNPRYGYNYTGATALGIMIEKGTTNLALWSEAINTTWAAFNATASADAATAPDGNATADTLTGAAGSNPQARYQSTSFTATTIYSVSQWQKEGTSAFGHLTFGGGSTTHYVHSTANLNTGAVTQSGAGGNGTKTGQGIDAYASSWYRHWLAGSFSSGTGDFNYIALSNSGTPTIGNYGLPANFDGTGYDIDVWGYQFEASPYPTSYVPTTSGSAARAAETLIDATLSWWNGSAGTIYWEGTIYAPSGTHILWQFDDNTADERHTLWADGTSIKYTIVDGAATVAELTLGTMTPLTAFKVAVAFAANDIAGIMSGGTIQTDNTATLPTIDRCRYGHDTTGNQLDGWIKNVKFDGVRNDNTALESLVA